MHRCSHVLLRGPPACFVTQPGPHHAPETPLFPAGVPADSKRNTARECMRHVEVRPERLVCCQDKVRFADRLVPLWTTKRSPPKTTSFYLCNYFSKLLTAHKSHKRMVRRDELK